MINDRAQELILDLALSRIDLGTFYQRYPEDIRGDDSYVSRMLGAALAQRDGDLIDLALTLRGHHRHVEPLERHAGALLELLKAPWHELHERLVDHLAGEAGGRVAEAFYQTASREFSYLDESENQVIRTKAIYGLRDIGSPAATRCLEKLSTEADDQSAALAARLRRELNGRR